MRNKRVTTEALTMHLAQANVAHMRGSYDEPIMAGFVARLDPLNEIADTAFTFGQRFSQ